MNKQADAATIRRIECEYSPVFERHELEDWIAQELYDVYHKLSFEPYTLRFRQAFMIFFPERGIINATRLVEENVTEHSVLLSSFLYKNYGVLTLNDSSIIDMALMLCESDFEFIASQVADELLCWYDNIDFANYVCKK